MILNVHVTKYLISCYVAVTIQGIKENVCVTVLIMFSSDAKLCGESRDGRRCPKPEPHWRY